MNLRYTVIAHLAQLKSILKLNLNKQLKASTPLFSALPSGNKTNALPAFFAFLVRKKEAGVRYFFHFSSTRKIAVPTALSTFYAQKKALLADYWVDFLWEHPIKFPNAMLAFYADKKEELNEFLDDHLWLKETVATRKKELKYAFLGLVYLSISALAFSLKSNSLAQNQGGLAGIAKVKYGFDFSQFEVEEDKIKHGDAIFSMLKKRGLTTKQADSLLAEVKESYDFKKIKVGKPYTFLCRDTASYMVLEPDAKRYFVFNFKTPSVKEVKRPVSVREFEIGGKLRKTLYSSLASSGVSYSLIDMVQAALKNKFDMSKCEEGDEYKLIWEEELVDGHSVGINKLKSVYVKGQCIEKPFYAFYFANEKEKGWYENDSLPIRDGFIDSPVKNSTITSSFNLRRFHPILHYHRPHYGTDYAAPQGTPIMAVADGVVQEAKYDGSNGNYVKIQHKNTYETQYLHMCRFAKGIKTGTVVRQKQIIGYVGSTGLATGPHVCFRFKKLGAPVNHLTERFFSAVDSLNFKKLATTMKTRINNIVVLSDEEREKQKEVFVQMRKKP